MAAATPSPSLPPSLARRQAAWRRVVQLAVGAGIAAPGITASLAYFDTYRRGRLPANLVQVRRTRGGVGGCIRPGGIRPRGIRGSWISNWSGPAAMRAGAGAAAPGGCCCLFTGGLRLSGCAPRPLRPCPGTNPGACLPVFLRSCLPAQPCNPCLFCPPPSPAAQAQRDFFGSHTYERVDKPAGQWFHTVWDEAYGSADSITTSGYNQ